MAKSDMDGSCLFNSVQQQLYRPDIVEAFTTQEFRNMVAVLTAEEEVTDDRDIATHGDVKVTHTHTHTHNKST